MSLGLFLTGLFIGIFVYLLVFVWILDTFHNEWEPNKLLNKCNLFIALWLTGFAFTIDWLQNFITLK